MCGGTGRNAPSLHIHVLHLLDKTYVVVWRFFLTSAALEVIRTMLHNTLRVWEKDKS